MTAARLYLAQTIDVALNDVASRIAAGKRKDPLAPADLLLPTQDSIAYARQRLGKSIVNQPAGFCVKIVVRV